MAPLLLEGIFKLGGALIDRFFPDPEKKAAAQLDLLKMQQTGELAELAATTDLAKLQIQTNIEEAKSASWWVAGWRPGIGWVCVAILGMTYIPKALALTVFWAYATYATFANPGVVLPPIPPFPDLGLTDVLGILGTLLGSGYVAKLRTDEKKADVEGNR